MAMPAALARYHANKNAPRPARRGPSPLVAKLRESLTRANKRARNAVAGGSGLMKDAAAFGGGFGYGVLEPKLPERLGVTGFSVPTSLAVAALGAFVLPKVPGFNRGSTLGKLGHDATLGVCGVAGYKIGTGTPVLGDTAESDGLSGGGWSDAT